VIRTDLRRLVEGEALAGENAVTVTATDARGNTSEVSVRPVSSEDRERLGRMLSRISPRTVYERFHAPYPSVPGWALADKLPKAAC
jgi:hypothetical protein